MEYPYIYVFKREHADRMLAMGYELVKSGGGKADMWCFANKLPDRFAGAMDFPYVASDVLTF